MMEGLLPLRNIWSRMMMSRKQLKDSAGEVLDAAAAALKGINEADWHAEKIP